MQKKQQNQQKVHIYSLKNKQQSRNQVNIQMKSTKPKSQIPSHKQQPNNTIQQQSVIITNISNKENTQKRISYLLPKQILVKCLIKEILNVTEQKIDERQLIDRYLNQYGLRFATNYVQQTLLLEFNKRQMQKLLFQGFEPVPLRSDNLIPVGTNLQQRNNLSEDRKSSPQSIGTSKIPRSSSILSIGSLNKKNPLNETKKNPKAYEYIKLNEQDLPKVQVQNDPFIDQLRKQKQSSSNKNQSAKRTDKRSNIRQIIKKDQKISFDFTGDILKIKQSNQKINFLARFVHGNQNNLPPVKQKQPKIDQNPINIDNGNKKDSSKRNLSKRAPDIQFSNINSLAPEIHINQGVKFIHNKATLQKKKKQSSITQLKKSITTKNLSKIDFQRLKSLGNNRSIRQKNQSPSLPAIQKSQIEEDKTCSILERSASQAKIQNSKSMRSIQKRSIFHTQKSIQRISIQNEQLSQMLLQKNFNSLEDTYRLQLPSSQKLQLTQKSEALSSMDRANLHYIKTGSVGKLQFPKITHRISGNKNTQESNLQNVLSSKVVKLKGRKRQNQFQRVRKHFQDKLRT